MTCNGDCFNCIYDDCVVSEPQLLRLMRAERGVSKKVLEAKKEKDRERARSYYQKHREACKAKSREWKKAHPEKVAEYVQRQKEKRAKARMQKETSQP